MGVCNQAGFCKMYSERGHPHSLKHLPKLSEVRTKLVILTMTFLITHKVRNVGGPRPRPTWPMPKNGPAQSNYSFGCFVVGRVAN